MKHEGDTMGKGKQTIRSLSKKAVLIRTRLPKKPETSTHGRN